MIDLRPGDCNGSNCLLDPPCGLMKPPTDHVYICNVNDSLVPMKTRRSWHVPASDITKRCRNPIRGIVEGLKLSPNPDKPMIALSVGDPTLFGNLRTPQEVFEAVVDSVKSLKCNGYAPSTGYEFAREAIAKYLVATNGDNVTEKDIVICSGCSQALEMCITVLANPGQNILLPKPGFPLYKMVAEYLKVDCKFYDLLPDKNWEVDLKQLESLIDSNTAAIVVNSPSNPCGSVFSKQLLLDILAIAARHYVPIISDEVYEHFVFKGEKFYSLGSLSEDVPILSCSGLTKRFLVPGWRLGWISVHDRHNAFGPEINKALVALSQRILGSNTLVQGALPTILTKTPESFFEDTIAVVENNARLAYSLLHQIPGLKPIMPAGAMYMMIRVECEVFPDFSGDLEFVESMVTEQSVFCLPGVCFDMPGFVRIVLTIPETLVVEACNRIGAFCQAHYRPNTRVQLVSITSGPSPLFGRKHPPPQGFPNITELQLSGESEKHNGFHNGFHGNSDVSNILNLENQLRKA